MSELAEGSIGPEAKYSIKFEGGKVLLSLQYEGQLLGSSMEVHIGGRQFLDSLKQAIPGQIDDAVINMLEAALGI